MTKDDAIKCMKNTVRLHEEANSYVMCGSIYGVPMTEFQTNLPDCIDLSNWLAQQLADAHRELYNGKC
jgi:hypothetical protein